jgi:orotate phosphoribosyltransferase
MSRKQVARNLKTKYTEQEVKVLSKAEQRITLRSFQEVTDLFEKCRYCKHYSGGQNPGCTKGSKNVHPTDRILRLISVGFCPVWDDPAENSLALKFWTYADLAEQTLSLVPQIDPQTGLIVGSARSGLIPAAILAGHLHLPMYSIDKEGVWYSGKGYRLKRGVRLEKILLVEDTVYSGNTLSRVLKVLEKEYPTSEISVASVFVHPKSLDKVDFYSVALPGRHYLEWNFFNSIGITRAIFDFDGILCEDQRYFDEDSLEDIYIEQLEKAQPKYYVRKEAINVICTARLERFRKVTEAWLDKHGIKFKRLIMGPWNSNEERCKPGEIAKFKASIYSQFNYNLFIESEPNQAREIAIRTGKEVLCPKLGRVLNASIGEVK